MDIPQSLLYLILFIYIEGTLGSYIPFTTDPVVLAPFTTLAPLAPHVCEPICEDRCIYGKERDSYGCLLCTCREARSEQCRQEKEYGTCSIKKDPVQRYYFNQTKGECEPFLWEGCESNDNNFISHMDCEHTCGYCKEIVCKHSCPNGYQLDKKGCPTCWCVLKPSKNKECNVKREKCGERQTRFFYNQVTGDCQIYYYGGCSSNSNSFLSFEGCRDSCVCDPMVECNLDCDHGFKRDNRGCQICECRPQSCNATICKNDNYCYDKVLDAMGCKTCECKRCFEPKKIGPCDEPKNRYFYNKTSRKCEEFTWSGCQKNGNNFYGKNYCRINCE